MKKVLIILGIIVVSIFALGILKDQVIRSTITVAASSITGAPVEMDGFQLRVLSQTVHIKGFRMYNPKGFPKEILVDIPKITVACDLGSLLNKKLHLKLIEFDLKEMGVIKNKEGKLNVESLKVIEEAKKPTDVKKKPAETMPIQIDELVLSAGKVVYKDFTAGPRPSVQVYDIGFKNKTYKNITSVQQMITLILSESLKGTAIQSAKVYAASTILGVGFLPAGVAITLLGNASGRQSFDKSLEAVYQASLAILKQMGEVTEERKGEGLIKALINKVDVTVKIENLTQKTTQVVVTAKRLLLPKPEIAKGVLYEISEKLK